MNTELLLKVKEHFLQHPEQLSMCTWVKDAECGTVACLAGWTCLLGVPGIRFVRDGHAVLPSGEEVSIPHFAGTLLGIEEGRLGRLFLLTGWPYEEYEDWVSAGSLPAKARVAAQRIDNFIQESAHR
jgi:hypothetical protein